MAEAILSPLLDAIVGNLASAAIEEFRQAWGWGVDEELDNLSSTLSAIQAVLEDAEDRHVESKATKDWLRKLKDVAYDADDLLDEFAIEAQRSKSEGRIQTYKRRKVCDTILSLFSSRQDPFQRDMARRIKEIREQLDRIAKDRFDLHLRARDSVRRLEFRPRPQTSSLIDESDVFGRERDREQIIESLVLSGSSRKDVQVISIVGMGGLGKKTLSQLVYNDERVEKHFELRAWACASEDFDVGTLTKQIIESATGIKCDFSGLDPMQWHLQETVSGKRFLLVLDDVWNEKYSDWEQLRVPLRVGAKGGKILVTTRSEIVSSVMNTVLTHRLGVLPDDDCWSLFERRAFADDSIDSYPELVAIAKKIVGKCRGLPLAVKALGGLLSSKRCAREWENILRSEIWDLPERNSDILPALRLSYQHLPIHLKQCFAFCSICPKGYKFVKEELVQLWIAEGFVQHKEGNQIEDAVREYFDDLLFRSFFQCSHETGGGQYCYRMHDLIHDLSRSISGGECFRIECGKVCSIPEKCRHMSLTWDDDTEPMDFEAFTKSKGLRTLLFIHSYRAKIEQAPQDMLLKFRCLRVLDFSSINVAELSNSIGNLKHLRYLDLSWTRIRRLPESLCSIYNLQTLKLKGCRKLIELPNDTRNLINLQHLNLENCHKLKSTPPGIGKLTSLQTLSMFIVNRERGQGIGELKDMKSLRGSLQISKLENVVNVNVAHEANFKNKPCIHELQLEWSHVVGINLRNERVEEEVLEGFQPHPNLQKLSIGNYNGNNFPSWMRDLLLPNLVSVDMYNCRRCSLLPSLGQLRFLKYLCVHGMDELKIMGREFCGDGIVKGFPSLEALRLTRLPNLEDWCSVEEGDFPCLRRLSIQYCSRLRALPHLPPTLTELEISDCKGLTALPLFPCLCKLELFACGEMVLRSVPQLTSLSFVRLSGFCELTSLPKGLLQPLTKLKELEISSCLKLASLLNGVGLQEEGLPITLMSLEISHCGNLKSLPKGLQRLTSLQRLKIAACSQLSSLPEEGLPTNLQSLIMFGCPMLTEQCKKDGGEYWPKISHIPDIRIDFDKISQH
ncbi:putative disease resistance protein RGA3 [Magnolia sinica]|uniref:putative disease resistance protein RGA3 n=1 Tax=Magnolia sinica TaxID=86752 RepID=UPI0026598685|nr:putative disease resistance protein RGA3 [Magnolia sinica]